MYQRLIALAVGLAVGLTPAPAAFAAGTGVGQYNLPSLGTVAGADLTTMDERQLGEQLMRRVRGDASFMSDPETTDYLNRLGYRLVAAGDPSPYDFFFFPIRNKTLNAFALPGGFVAVHSGLIVAAQTESELAGVIGHEIGHVTQRHIARMLQQGEGSLAMTLGSILLALLAARAGGSSGGDAAMGIVMGTQAAMIQKQLGYSRDAEREADRVGLVSLEKAGFDPHGMEDFFGRLQKNNRWYETASTAYLSTHPLTGERISDMQNRTRTLPKVKYDDSLDFKLIQSRMRVLQETNFDGWSKAVKSFDQALKEKPDREREAAIHYGKAVAYQKMNRLKDALAEVELAKNLAGVSDVVIDKLASELVFANAKTAPEKKKALELARSTAQKYPYSGLAATNYAELLHQAGEDAAVVKFVRSQKAITRSDPDYYAYLARSYEALGQKSLSFSATGYMYELMNNPRAALYQFDLAQKANDADFYAMSEIDAKLRELRERVSALDKDK